MALLERRLKQRIVGAGVLLALVVVFLPMLFNRDDEQRRVRVEAPPMPAMPSSVETTAEPVVVSEASLAGAAPVVPALPPAPTPPAAEMPPSPPSVAPEPVAAVPAASAQPDIAPAQPPAHLDADGVPISWSVQLASLSSRARAEELQQKLRGQGFDAYIRTVDGMNRVFVGPLLERADAERLRERIARQHRLSPIVVRFQPERR